MLIGDSEDTCEVPLLGVLRWVEEGLGNDPALYLIDLM